MKIQNQILALIDHSSSPSNSNKNEIEKKGKKNRADFQKHCENVFENDRMQQNSSRRAITASSEMFPPTQNELIFNSSAHRTHTEKLSNIVKMTKSDSINTILIDFQEKNSHLTDFALRMQPFLKIRVSRFE